jgi:beta-glucanase (GH16 family)
MWCAGRRREERMRMKRVQRTVVIPAVLVVLISLFIGCPSPPDPLERFTAPPPSGSADTWDPAGRTLVWSDEFTGPDINLQDWCYETEATGWCHEWNGEWQHYTDNDEGGSNACINNGALVLRALENGGGLEGYTSARLVTKGKRSWRYGTIVARMQLPYGQGMWPAFWLMGNTGAWPANGEIDVMEMIGGNTAGGTGDRRTYGTIHWAGTNTPPDHKSAGGNYLNAASLSADWHYYELEWNATTITIRFDGHDVMSRSIVGAEFDEFRQPFYLLFNLAVGGTWGGYPDGTTVFPQYMYIDWVRVYQ